MEEGGNAVRMKLDGFGLFVQNMPAMVRFYRDVLGFEIREPEDAVNVYMVKDGTVFMLYRRSDFEKMAGRSFQYVSGMNGHFEMALQVENYAAVDRVFREVTARGAAAVMEPETMPWGQRTCYVADPEGNLIEIGAFEEEHHG